MRSELNQNCVRRYSEIQFHFEHSSCVQTVIGIQTYYPEEEADARKTVKSKKTYRTNVLSIVNSSYSTTYMGNPQLVARSIAQQQAPKGK
jgi:hypothetical protein